MTNEQNGRDKEIIQYVLGVLKKELSPHAIYLFGSRAKGTNDDRADFDFAVDCEAPLPTKKNDLLEQIEEGVGLYSVDVTFMPEVDDKFKKIILSTGRCLYER